MTQPVIDPQWRDRAFAELTARELHAIYALRARVFVVEQACAYQDIDELDLQSRHVWAEADGRIVAYLRIIPAGAKYAELSIGRVVTAPEARGVGLGRELMTRGLALAGDAPLRLGAQAYLERFYTELGFVRASDIYDEDGIPHIEMTRAPPFPR
jgi:ElaA protein